MSHLSVDACTQRLAAGRGHGYRLAAAAASTARARNWQWSSLLYVNDDHSAQCDKPLDGSRCETPSNHNNNNNHHHHYQHDKTLQDLTAVPVTLVSFAAALYFSSDTQVFHQ